MKIWCVDHSGLSWNIHSDLYFTKEEAQAAYNKYDMDGFYRKMYQVEDIWGWCARHFEHIIERELEDCGLSTGIVDVNRFIQKIREAAVEVGVCEISVKAILTREGFDDDISDFTVSIAWYQDHKMFHKMYAFEGREV